VPVPEPLRALLAADPLAGLLGIRLEEVTPGGARLSMTVRPEHTNAFGACHGGTLMALVDAAHGAAANSHGTLAVAAHVHVELTRAAYVGDRLVATGTELSAGSRSAVYRLEVHDEASGALVLTGLGRVIRLGRPLLPGA